jgi:hypothetical protein
MIERIIATSRPRSWLVNQLPKRQLGGLATEHCFAAIGSGQESAIAARLATAQKPGGASRGMQVSVHEKWRPVNLQTDPGPAWGRRLANGSYLVEA